ncbi:intermembrane lipid transfer protein Vps13-like [Drosophila kikkawai]|uniref:Intermembrane lipid transfer protein Vps13-like n=1 Tax=Drosophila kikkawai TaxID=30033 RepID=A0A6P4HUB3_DROKI|nr:vacuolar protein sorting-associated protein 13-like [Drosophila kikkawai]
MVFEAVVADVLNKFLGDYIENLDRKQLKIGIWGGDVVLQNLKIRENALDELDLDLPVKLIYGYVDKLILNIPWKRLYTQPVIVNIEGVYALVTPNSNVRYNPEKEAKREMDLKKKAIATLESARKKELEKDQPKPQAGFTEKLTAQIVNNLQVLISNVHLRYEDTTTTGSPFSFGISLHRLELYTTDCDWEKCYMAQQAAQVYKMAYLDSLSAYLNCGGQIYARNTSHLVEQFQDNIASKDSKPAGYNYVLGPISCNAKLKLNMNPDQNDPPFQIAKIDLTLEMEKLNVGLTNIQFENLIKLGDAMNRQQLAIPYRKYRPYDIPVKGHAKVWWKFAITAVLEEDVRKSKRTWTWKYIKEHCNRCDSYAQKYKEQCLSKKPSPALIESCNLLEQKIDIFNLLLIRERVNIEIEKQREAMPKQKAGWFSGWGGGSKTQGQKLVEKFEAAMTSEEKAKMYTAIGYEKNMVPTDMPERYEAIKMKFKLVALEVGLYKEEPRAHGEFREYKDLPSLVLLKFLMATASLIQRPAAGAVSLTAGIRELKATGFKTPENTPMLIASKITDEFNLLDVFFETNPLDKKCDQRVKMVLRPLQIVYDAPTVMALISAFKRPQDVTVNRIEDAASSQIANFKERSATGMHYVIEQKTVLDVDILLMPNTLILPDKGVYREDEASLLVVSLGQVHLTSTARDLTDIFSTGEEKADILKAVMDSSYDRFTVKVADVQMLVVAAGEAWETALMNAESTEMHVLRPISLEATAALCVIDNDPRLPKMKVDIDLPSVLVNISEDRVILAMRVVMSIPKQEDPQPHPQVITHKSMSAPPNFNKEVKKKIVLPTAQPAMPEVVPQEITQYTNMEVNFSLGEVYFVLFQSSRWNETRAKVSFLGELPAETGCQILSIDILRVEAYFVSRTYESVASVKLGDITMRQFGCPENNSDTLDMILTPKSENSSNYLFTVTCTMASKTSPEFSTKYDSTEQLIVANFEDLEIVLHQEYLLKLVEVANRFQSNMDYVMSNYSVQVHEWTRSSAGGGDGIGQKLSFILEEQIMTPTETKPLQDQRYGRVESVKVRLMANLEQVGLKLTSLNRDLAGLTVRGFVCSLIMKNSYTDVNLGLKDIQIVDLNPQTIHKNILTIVGKDAFNCQVVLFNKEETLAYNSDDMKITVEIGCLRIIFLNWFVAGVLNFLNHFSRAQEAITQASAAAAETARQKAMDAYETATRMKLDIRIKAPIIIVPTSSRSLNALALDLGLLELTNDTVEIAVANREQLAVIDEIKLRICDVKLIKVTIMDGHESIVDEMDSAVGYLSKSNIMNPMSFTLLVKRNLSYGWYKDVPELDLSGHLKTIELTFFATDYALVMLVMNYNLNEGLEEFPPSEEPPEKPKPKSSEKRLSMDRQARPSLTLPNEKIVEAMKFNFQFDGVVISLMESEHEGLARFGIYFLSIEGSKLDNGTLSSTVVLCNIQVDDTRSSSEIQIRQYLRRKDWGRPQMEADDIIELCYNERDFMIDIKAVLKENDTFAEIRVRGFGLIVCIDFLLRLSTFFSLPVDETPQPTIKVKRQSMAGSVQEAQKSLRQSSVGTANEFMPKQSLAYTAVSKKVNLILHIDEPEIILVESLEELDTSCIIFSAHAHLNFRGINDKQIINGEIDSLKMYMCAFLPDRRDTTRHYILHPCVISLQGSTPEEEGMHISLKLSDIIINISPATIELLNKAMVSISSGKEISQEVAEAARNYSTLWKEQPLKSRDYWFTRPEKEKEVMDYQRFPEATKTEKCVIEMPSVTLVIESGIGYYTKPLISLDTRLTAVFNDWSSNLTAQGSLTVNMNYYNQTLAEWEPIIELNEVMRADGVREYIPWELKFEMGTELVYNEAIEDQEEQQAMYISIHSIQTLEITLSKTCLGLLGELGEAFSQAIDEEGLTKPGIVAPYMLENDTGYDVELDLRKGMFMLHDMHNQLASVMPSTSSLFLSNYSVDVKPSAIDIVIIASGGRAYLQTKDLSMLTSEEDVDDYSLYVTIRDMGDIEIALPVSKSDTRFFNLMTSSVSEPYGIVSEVKQVYGTTKVNIHGVVSIHNHFTCHIDVYRRNTHPTVDNFQDIFVGRVKRGQVFHVPLHAIYADVKELYFSMRGYRTSDQGFAWNSNLSEADYSNQLHCNPTKTYEPLYINVRRKKTEIYHEYSNKYTILSAFYTIHLRPPLYLRNALPIEIMVSVAGCSVSKDGLNAQSSMQFSGESHIREEFLDYGEKTIKPGSVLHLPTVRLSSTKSFLVVRMMQYLEKDWSCVTEISEDTGDVDTWVFSSYDSAMKVNKSLYVKSDNREGSLMLTLFSPFWLINKTGLMLSYQTESTSVDVLYHPSEFTGPILLTFRDKVFSNKKKASIRIDNGSWSQKIPMDIAGAKGWVTCHANNRSYHIGVHNHLTQNTLTKQVTFIPFYIVCNRCRFPIELQEQSRLGDPWLLLETNQFEPFWPKTVKESKVVVRVRGKITPAFDYTEVVCTLLKLEDSKKGGINVDVQTTEGGVYITFTEYKTADAPGMLINHTKHEVVYYEKGSNNEHILNAKSTIMYAWDDPTGSKVLVFGTNKQETDLKRDNTGDVVTENGSKALWVSFLDGLQRVLLFTESESIARRTESNAALQSITQSIDLRILGVGFSLINNESGVDILYLGVTSSGIIWESKKTSKKRFKEVTINENALIEAEYTKYLAHKKANEIQTYKLDKKFPIDFDRMILKKTVERNIRRNFYPAIWVSRKSSPFQNQLHLKINRIQVDNQSMDPIFAVVLAPIPPPKSMANTTALKPFLECSMVQRIMPNSTVRQFKYAKLLIQEFHFKVDLKFLTAIGDLFAKEVSDETEAKQFLDDVDSIVLPLSVFFENQSLQEQKSFYDNLHLGPLKIHLSFSMGGSDTKTLPGFLGSVLGAVGVTLTEVNDVVFRLAYFEREYQFFTQSQLMSEIQSHYTGQTLKQLYVLVLGLDVLGNPYGLVVGLKKGVQDLFYEPLQGAIQGPQEFAEGLVIGLRSLFAHTVGGASAAMSKITGAMGKGLAVLTFDEQYQKKRRRGFLNKPRNFHEGLARSSKGLVMGFAEGATGVVTKPMNGAREQGAGGFIKGLGKGAIGLVIRPIAGLVDFTSGSFDAVKRAAEATEVIRRMRPPRFQHYDMILRPYCYMDALGNKILMEADKSIYADTDSFIHCEEILKKFEYMIVSDNRLLYVQRNEMFNIWTSLWSYLWSEIRYVTAVSRGVQITTKAEGKKTLGLFRQKESPRKLVLLADERKRLALVDIIDAQLVDLNPHMIVVSYPEDD